MQRHDGNADLDHAFTKLDYFVLFLRVIIKIQQPSLGC
jgi:hypothetical protein